MNLDNPQEREETAGEYVVGTLQADDRRVFEAALAQDPALQRLVYEWQDRLLGLAARARPVDVPATVWDGIARRLPESAASAARRPEAAANDAPLRRWRWIGGLAVAASLVFAALLVRPLLMPPPERYLAVLQSPTGADGWIVEVTAERRVRLVPVAPGAPVPPGKVLQFWTKGETAAGPTSLGLVKPGVVTELPVATLPELGERQLFELTLEPEGGSPIGRPTGPILFVGKTVRL